MPAAGGGGRQVRRRDDRGRSEQGGRSGMRQGRVRRGLEEEEAGEGWRRRAGGAYLTNAC